MKKPSNESQILNNLLGFSENLSIQKSYYPQLQTKIKELESEKEKYFNLFNNISDAIFITDNHGIIKDLNHESVIRFEYTKKELIGKSILLLVEKKQHTDINDAIQLKFSKNLETAQITKSKTSKYTSINVQKIIYEGSENLLFVCHDITNKKLFELEIENAKNYIDDLFNSIPSIIIGVDNNCLVTHCNKNAEKWLYKELNEFKGKEISIVIQQLKNFENIIRSSIINRKVISDLKIRDIQNNIEYIYEVTVFPLQKSENGAVVKIDDISEKINLEKMIIQSEKMLSIGGLAAGMAHEINNPLAGMIQNANVLKNRLAISNEKNKNIAKECNIEFTNLQEYFAKRNIEQLLSHITESGKKAAEIVRSMLNFARNNDMEKSYHDIIDIIDESIKLSTHDYDIHKRHDFKKIVVNKNFNLTQKQILCNKSQLGQVFFNLMKNSAEAFFESQIVEQKIITIEVYSINSMVVIEFIDNGPGIPDDIVKKVFDPFFTTKEPGFGTGLGLFVSYYIITENHNGSIEVEKIFPHGTKFKIQLPVEER